MNTPLFVLLFDVESVGRQVIREVIGEVADITYLPDVEAAARAAARRRATVLLAQNTAKELTPDELALIRQVRLLQFYTAGVDFLPLQDLPADLPIATNGGAFAEPMAEHALALALAAAKRLFIEHRQLATGAFNQFTPNRMLAGRVCGMFGFGGVGVATARLMRAMGMQIHAINRRGHSAEPTDWIGTPAQLDVLLRAADVLVIAAPLTRATLGRIGARELALMKEDAILVNLARGEIIEEGALFAHLQRHPTFTACLDAWWVEPVRHGAFRMPQPVSRHGAQRVAARKRPHRRGMAVRPQQRKRRNPCKRVGCCMSALMGCFLRTRAAGGTPDRDGVHYTCPLMTPGKTVSARQCPLPCSCSRM